MAQVAWHIYCAHAGRYSNPYETQYRRSYINGVSTLTSGVRWYGYSAQTSGTLSYLESAYLQSRKGTRALPGYLNHSIIVASNNGSNGNTPMFGVRIAGEYNGKKIIMAHGGSTYYTMHTAAAGYLITLTNGIQFYLAFHHDHGYSTCRYPNIYGIDDTWVGFSPSSQWNEIDRRPLYPEQDSAFRSLSNLTVPSANTPITTARDVKSNADRYWNIILTVGATYPNYTEARNKYNDIVSAVGATEARDTRLVNIADKSEIINTRNALRFNYMDNYNTGINDYSVIKNILSNRLKSGN